MSQGNLATNALVPTVQVLLVQSFRISPKQAAVVPVHCDWDVKQSQQELLVEAERELDGLVVESSVLMPPKDDITQMVVSNDSGFTQRLDKGTVLGVVESAEVLGVSPDAETVEPQPTTVSRCDSSDQGQRKIKLLDKLKLPALPPDELRRLKDLLADHHDVFSVEEGERGETDIVQFGIDTGDSPPQKQPPRRMTFVVRKKVAKQIKQMQESGVVRPSNSSWSSPVVMVKK